MNNFDRDLDAFISINAPFYTLTELAEEAGENTTTISNICNRLGIKCITIKERYREYISSHMDQNVNEMAECLKVKVHTLNKVIKDMGLVFPPAKQIDKPLGLFNPEAVKRPEIKFTAKQGATKVAVFKEFASKYGGGVTFTDLIYPQEKSWNI